MPRFHEKKDFLKFLDKDMAPMEKVELDIFRKTNSFPLNPEFIIKESKEIISEKQGDIFVLGIKVPYKVLETGTVIRSTKSFVYLNKNKKGELIFDKCIELQGRKTGSKKLKNLVAEAYLIPRGENPASYAISLKDGNEVNCSVDNISIRRKGYTGVAVKKAIKITKNGNFYAIVDSVNKCSELLKLPRRTVSKLLSQNQDFKNFSVSYY